MRRGGERLINLQYRAKAANQNMVAQRPQKAKQVSKGDEPKKKS
jgi:hypothetical protein